MQNWWAILVQSCWLCDQVANNNFVYHGNQIIKAHEAIETNKKEKPTREKKTRDEIEEKKYKQTKHMEQPTSQVDTNIHWPSSIYLIKRNMQ